MHSKLQLSLEFPSVFWFVLFLFDWEANRMGTMNLLTFCSEDSLDTK